MGSALLNTMENTGTAEAARNSAPATANTADTAQPRAGELPESAAALRELVAERLAAHRSRRSGAPTQPASPAGPARSRSTRSATIAAAVAERYAHTQSYRAFLAAEAECATQQARAAAEVAALNAQAVAAAQQTLLDALDQAASDEAVHRSDQHLQNIQPAPPDPPDAAHRSELQQSEMQENAAAALNLWPDLDPAPTPQHRTHHHTRPHTEPRPSDPTSNLPQPRTPNLEPPFTVRLYEDAAIYRGASRRASAANHANRYEERNEAEARALDEEIAFRQAPVFEEPTGPPVPLPANLIEFPRQLIASRKARPRYAEGPLREDADNAPGDGQLRIFEVDPAQISTTPDADAASNPDPSSTPQWTSIWLDTPLAAQSHDGPDRHPTLDSYDHALGTHAGDSFAEPSSQAVPLIEPASLSRRTVAAAINGAIGLTGLLAFVAMFLLVADPAISIAMRAGASFHGILSQMASFAAGTGLPRNLLAAMVAVPAAFLALLYQALFFRFADATPGMRCARIALCTFDDENPTRRAIRRRAATVLLSACPLALGFLWAAIDEDRLTWHDRLTRMYQRTY
jgi:uncharacterized RDD family membrane protein YckC